MAKPPAALSAAEQSQASRVIDRRSRGEREAKARQQIRLPISRNPCRIRAGTRSVKSGHRVPHSSGSTAGWGLCRTRSSGDPGTRRVTRALAQRPLEPQIA
ncbi:hypothetical protein [Streptomyces sp900116325]